MREEISAGGIVFKRIGSTVFILVCKHSGHHGWVFPKGHVGDTIAGESKEDAALREVKEESGVVGNILQPLPPIDYWFEIRGEKYHKTVFYYLMGYVSGSIEHHDWEMEEVEWLPQDRVLERLTYPGDKKVWNEAQEILAQTLR